MQSMSLVLGCCQQSLPFLQIWFLYPLLTVGDTPDTGISRLESFTVTRSMPGFNGSSLAPGLSPPPVYLLAREALVDKAYSS